MQRADGQDIGFHCGIQTAQEGPMTNPREDEARSLKAAILVAFLTQYGITHELARRMERAEWEKVASLARMHVPSLDKTVPLILDEMRRREMEDFRKRLRRLERKTRPKATR
jgi:hypothetical protein